MREVTQSEELFPMKSSLGREEANKPTILLVEDEKMLRELICEVLECAGYEVLPCAHPDEGIEASRKHESRIDLLLTDVVLPGMNGREMSNQILERLPKLHVVFMSGYSEQVLMERGQFDPEFEYLQKPFSLRTLTKKLASVLEERVQ
jgi:two-component system, cell cycle sensor histidine kinase and response regulator CckA